MGGSRGDKIDAEIDICGEICPFTFVRTKLALEALPIGGTLRVVVDHHPAVKNIPRSAREWGQEVLAVREIEPIIEPVEPAISSAGPSRARWAIDLRRLVR